MSETVTLQEAYEAPIWEILLGIMGVLKLAQNEEFPSNPTNWASTVRVALKLKLATSGEKSVTIVRGKFRGEIWNCWSSGWSPRALHTLYNSAASAAAGSRRRMKSESKANKWKCQFFLAFLANFSRITVIWSYGISSSLLTLIYMPN